MGEAKVGLQTGDNNRFLRLWNEVNCNKIGYNMANSQEALENGTNQILGKPLIPYEKIDFSSLNRKPEVITDTNMITEYKYGAFNQ